MLLTRISIDGNCRAASIAAFALARSAAKGSSFAFGCDLRMDSIASDTRSSVRPFTITRAPSAASDLAMAKPIPAVEPVTNAVLFSSFKFMDVPVARLFCAKPAMVLPLSSVLVEQKIAAQWREENGHCPSGTRRWPKNLRWHVHRAWPDGTFPWRYWSAAWQHRLRRRLPPRGAYLFASSATETRRRNCDCRSCPVSLPEKVRPRACRAVNRTTS